MGLTQPALRACISPWLPNHRLILHKPWPRGLRTVHSTASLRRDWEGSPGMVAKAVRAALAVQEEGLVVAVVEQAEVAAAAVEQEAAAGAVVNN